MAQDNPDTVIRTTHHILETEKAIDKQAAAS